MSRYKQRGQQAKRILEKLKKKAAPTTVPVKPGTKPQVIPKTTPTAPPRRDPFSPPRPTTEPKPKAKKEEEVVESGKRAAQLTFEKPYLDPPFFPIKVVFEGTPDVISRQMQQLREQDPDFTSEQEDESELVEEFVEFLHKLHDKAGDGYRSVEDAITTANQFVEKYPEFRSLDFAYVDSYGERSPIDLAGEWQQKIPGIGDF